MPLQVNSSSAALHLPCSPHEVDQFLSKPPAGAIEALARTPGAVLVLGAGGKMGLHLCLMLRRAFDHLGRKDDVIAVSRFQEKGHRDVFNRAGMVVHACDLSDESQLSTLPEAPIVFYLAGVKFGTASQPGLLWKANGEMPHRVAMRLRHSRIVAFSTGCVYPFVRPETGGTTEKTHTEPLGDYAASCLAREQAFARASLQYRTAVALIRLNYSVEFRYGLLVDIAVKVMRGEPVDVTTGYVNVIWQTDALGHIIQCLALADSPAVPVNITGADVLSVRELAHEFGVLLQRPVTIVGKEAETAWLNNAAWSHRLFGPPPTPVSDMMRWIVAWLKHGGATLGKPTGFERRDGQF